MFAKTQNSASAQLGPAHVAGVAVMYFEDARGNRSGLPVDVVVAKPSDLEKYGDSPGLEYREALRDGRDLYVA